MKTNNNQFCENYQLEDFLTNGGYAMFNKIYQQYNRACQMDQDDCYQEYTIAAAHAIREYNPHRVDIKLFTFVWIAVENQAKMICRNEMAQKRAGNINPMRQSVIDHYFEAEQDLNDWKYPEVHSYERLCRDETAYQVDEHASVERIYRAIENAGLSELEKAIVMDSIHGFTQQEIGERCNHSQGYISKNKNEARRKLRIYLEVMA